MRAGHGADEQVPIIEDVSYRGSPGPEHEEVSVHRSFLSIAVRGLTSSMQWIWSTTKFALINATCNGKPGADAVRERAASPWANLIH
jgi:hypothetical protein